MKKENLMQDLQNFLGISQKQLAEFFNLSRTLFAHIASGNRKFPDRLNLRRLALFELQAHIEKEISLESQTEKPFTPEFLSSRLDTIETRIVSLTRQIKKAKTTQAQNQNALRFYSAMRSTLLDLTPIDRAWIQKEMDKITFAPPAGDHLERWQWEMKMLLLEKKEIKKES